jgi:iron uptake system EfeUOB component EfeO/EfeM
VVDEENASSVQDEDKINGVDKESPLGAFQMAESNNEEDKLEWMDFIGMAVNQIDSEVEGADKNKTANHFCHQESKIKNLRPDNSPWYPFLNKEASIKKYFMTKRESY